LEENYVKNSFATSILEFLNDNGIKRIIYRIALKSAIIIEESCYRLLYNFPKS